MNTRVVSEAQLLDGLLSPGTAITVSHHGVTTVGHEWSIGPRVVAEHMFLYLVSGAMTGTADDQDVKLQAGDLYWQQPGVDHHLVQAREHVSTRVYFFRIGFGDPPPRLKASHLVLNDQDAFGPLMPELLQLFNQSDPLHAYRVRCLFGELFCRALTLSRAAASMGEGLNPRQAREAMDFIRYHLTERFTIADVAAYVQLNPDYFSRRFKESFGVPPQTMIKQERIRLAQSLLQETNQTVSEVAWQLGYNEVSYFSNQFQEVTGRRPSYWKRR